MTQPTMLYHVTSPKKAKMYRESGQINKPVRGFDCIEAAMAWVMKTRRTVIYAIPAPLSVTYKLPDHHNQFGTAWWVDSDVREFRCVYSAI